MKVFISYAREDIETARKLRDDLEKAGIKTWLDKVDLLPGMNWKATIRKEIRESSYFIALLSSKALSKQGFVHKELKTALDFLDLLPSGSIFVIPVRVDECEPADEKLQDIHWADLFPSYEKGLSQVLRVIVPEKPPSNVPKKLELQASKPKYQLRKDPITISDYEFKKIFRLNERLRPLENIENDFKDNSDGTITDHTTGLMWQKSGSDKYLTYKNAKTYINELNNNKVAGYSDWRLPTVDELKSLLTSDKQSNDLYIDPIFEKEDYNWFWSSDGCTSGGAWVVFFSIGDIRWVSLRDNLYVRAVRSIQ